MNSINQFHADLPQEQYEEGFISESDTPRTDEQHAQFRMGGFTLDFARQLERELTAARQEIKDLHKAYGFELRDPNGTIWEYTAKMQAELTAARAEIAEWRILNGWGGTPEIINDFIKGQQTRIHLAQNLEEELDRVTEQLVSIDSMYHKIIKEVLECDPIPACQREDDQLEPPWEVIARIREQRDRLAEALREMQYCHTDKAERMANEAFQYLTTNEQ
jgi:hypothetical protein